MPVDRREFSFRMPSPHRLSADHPKYDERCLTWERGSTGISLLSPCGLRGRLMNMYRKERHRAALRRRRARQEFLIRTGGFKRASGLPVSSQKPSPNAKTEQRNGDHCERKRRQPDWHAAHIEGPDDRCNQRCDCHAKKDSKGQIGLPAPGYAPQNQEQEKTGYLQQCCHD